jgi:hypothetical protein
MVQVNAFEQQELFANEAHKQRRLAERTMGFRAAHEQFVNHFKHDEPDTVELVEETSRPPENTCQCDETPFAIKRCYAWAKVVSEGTTPVYHVLVSGPEPYNHTYIWARFA